MDRTTAGENRIMSKIDLHVHTRESGDNDAEPEEVVERAVERGLDGIVITEHYSYAASEHADRLRDKYRGVIMVLRGVEFSAAEGHCLVFGIDTDRLSMKFAPVRDVIRIVNEAGGVVIPSHPYRNGNSLGDLVFNLSGIAGLEGCNGANMHAMNRKAIDAAERLRLPFSGGSDAHSPFEVGSCYTVFDDPVTPGNFLDRLRSGRYHGVDMMKISRFSLT
jgi:predicted metal-dependent phosphoesterase TrpH